MKLTLIREDKKNQMHVTLKSMESLMERITKDTKTEDVQALRRYLASDELDAVIVVTQRVTHVPASITGKPVYLVSLNRLWGVALP